MLEKSAEQLYRQDVRAYIKRMMWSDLDGKVEDVFNEATKNERCTSSFGTLYFSRSIDSHADQSVPQSKFQNSIHISTGTRFLGFNFYDVDTKKVTVATEKNAQLWYSQAPSGRVLVFIAPYTSAVGSVTESEIIIGNYNHPASITKKEINRHFSLFYKYCACSSQNDSYSWSNYFYRQKLKLKDFRFRGELKSKIMFVLERITIVVFTITAAVAAVMALK
ncbi:hypothetical protein V8065_004632 [Vibrio parahaemolyticus]